MGQVAIPPEIRKRPCEWQGNPTSRLAGGPPFWPLLPFLIIESAKVNMLQVFFSIGLGCARNLESLWFASYLQT